MLPGALEVDRKTTPQDGSHKGEAATDTPGPGEPSFSSYTIAKATSGILCLVGEKLTHNYPPLPPGPQEDESTCKEVPSVYVKALSPEGLQNAPGSQ